MANATLGSQNIDPAQSAVQKRLLMLNQKLSPEDTTAAATAANGLGSPSAPSTISGEAATPFAGTPNATGSTTSPKFTVSDSQRAEMDAAVAASAAQNAKSKLADQTDRLPPPPTPQPGYKSKIVGPDVNSPDFYKVPILGGIKRATDVIGQAPGGGLANAAATAFLGARPPVALPTSIGDALGTLMPPTNPDTGAAVADNPLYALGPAGNFAGETGPVVGGLASAIKNRIGGLGSLFSRGASVADEAANTAASAVKPPALPPLSEPVDAMVADSAAARAKAQQAVAQSQFQDTTGPALDKLTSAIKSGRTQAPRPGLGGVPIDNAPGGVLRGPTGEYIYNGQAYPTWAEARGAQIAAEQSATSASAAASGGLDQAIASKLGSIPGPVKAGLAAAGAAGVAGALAPTDIGGLPQASTNTTVVNDHNPNSPITDAAIAAQNAARNGGTSPTTPPPPTTTAPTPSTIGPSTTAPKTTPPQPPVQIPTGTGTNPFGGKTSTTTPPPPPPKTTTDTTTPPPPKLPTDTTTQPPGSSGQLQQQVMSDLNGIAQQLAAGPQTPDVMALFSTQAKSIIDLITQEETNLKAEADKNGSTIDPATQNTLDTLRNELDRQIKVNTEQMNSRGLFNSGILEQAQLELRKGNMSDQAKLLSERLTRIQDTLQSGLASLRTQKVGTLSSFGLAGAQAQTAADEAERNRIAALKGTLISGRTALSGQAQQGEQFAANQQFTAQQNDLTRQLTIASKNADLAAQAQDRQAQVAWEREKQQIQAQIDQNLQQARIDAGQYAPSPTQQAAADKAQGFDQGVTDSYLQNVRAFIAAGGDKQQLADFYAQNKSRMAQEGADLSKIEAAIR